MRHQANYVESEIVGKIESKLNCAGIMYRVFSRVKEKSSLIKKIESRSSSGYKIQDYIGIRLVLYFPDDIKIVHKIVSSIYSECDKNKSIDTLDEKTFEPVRYNLVYKLNEDDFFILPESHSDYIDQTFELQLRTVLSEGWHEVEHDLRYKHKDDWLNSIDFSRRMNGVLATLETSEWTMIQILDSVAYQHYKDGNFESMFRQKLRVRLDNKPLEENIKNVFLKNEDLVKEFFRIERDKVILSLSEKGFWHGLDINTLIRFVNLIFIKNKEILDLTGLGFQESYCL